MNVGWREGQRGVEWRRSASCCRDRVLAALRFEESDTVPYQLPMEDDVIERIDAHYGDPTWHEWLQQHVGFVGMPSLGILMDGPAVYADHFGTVWRVDKRPQPRNY